MILSGLVCWEFNVKLRGAGTYLVLRTTAITDGVANVDCLECYE
jgi:hypothetical protein